MFVTVENRTPSGVKEWPLSLVLPVKNYDTAKSRLPLTPGDRRRVAEALARRSIRLATSCLPGDRIYVVTDEPAAADVAYAYGAKVVTDEGEGLNLACEAAWAAARADRPDDAIGVLVADLPLLTRRDLLWVLHRTSHADSPAFVPDAHDTGTTFFGAPSGVPFPRLFGHRSAARFARAGCVRIEGAPVALRSDLDTVQDARRLVPRLVQLHAALNESVA
jgi:2-phospho-L-lactate guanylyltransferase